MTTQQEKILQVARSLIGTPYLRGAPVEEAVKHCDCSSFPIYVYAQVGIKLVERTTLFLAAYNGKEITDWDPATYARLEVGDLLFFRGTWGYYRNKLFPGRKIYPPLINQFKKNPFLKKVFQFVYCPLKTTKILLFLFLEDMLPFVWWGVYIGHVAIYSGNGMAIQSADPDPELGQVGKPGVWERPIAEIMMGRGPIVMVKRVL